MANSLYSQKSKVATVPAPIGGWNARDPLSAMGPTDAVVLDNWIPGTGGVELRRGDVRFATGLGSDTETLMQYSGPSGGNKLFAAAGEYIVDITSGGAFTPSVTNEVASLTNARFSSVMFGNASGNNFLVACNGADDVLNYDGTTWTTPTITGVTSADLIYVMTHMGRLWFIEKNSLRIWYLDVGSISGAATLFDLGSLCRFGGSLVAMAPWTRDGGAGSDDLAMFLTTKGEVILFGGSDPASASTWGSVGVFKISPPVGQRCVVKAGADLGIITQQGVEPLSSILPLASTDAGRVAVTDKIKGAFTSAYSSSGALFGWSVLEYPRGRLVIVNVPFSIGGNKQYVMNVATGAWCRFTGIPAICWSLLGDDIYYGAAGGLVYKYDQDYAHEGAYISADMLPAFSDFGTPQRKRFLQAKPLATAAQGTSLPIEMKTDFDLSPATISQGVVPSSGSPWDTSPWDTSSWGPSIVPVDDWQCVEGIGQTASPRHVVTSATPITLQLIEVTYEAGGVF